MLHKIKPNFELVDARGSLTQLVREGYTQFNIITSKAGVERGHHFHKHNSEAFYIISGKLRVEIESEEHIKNYTFESGDFFSIEPLDMHSFFFIEDTVIASMYSVGVEMQDGTKDIYTERGAQ